MAAYTADAIRATTAAGTTTERVTFTDVLPVRSGGPTAVHWTPGSVPGTGLLTIESRRCGCDYIATEYATPWDGRAVRLVKIDAGTDPSEESYDVFAGSNGQDHMCGCRGHARHGRCKHVDAVYALIGNGWLG